MDKENAKMPLQVIKASAGSGKTYQLTAEYIKLLLGEKNAETGEFRLKRRKEYHQHILAVTFTNKATEEMKKRIVKELSLLSRGEGDHVDSLMSELHTGKKELQQAARVALEELLFNYTTFNVSTIDSFFQTVLRTFAFELDQDYDYAVELDEKYTSRVASENLLMNVGRQGSGNSVVFKWIGDYMRQKFDADGGKGNGWNIFLGSELCSVAKDVTSEDLAKYRDDVAEYMNDVDMSGAERVTDNPRIKRFMAALKRKFEDNNDQFDAIAQQFNGLLKSVGLSLDMLSAQSGLSTFINVFIKKKDLTKYADYAVKCESGIELKKWSTDKNWKKRVENGEFLKEKGDMEQLVRDGRDVVKAYISLKSIIDNIYQFGLMGIIVEEMNKFLRDNDSVLLSGTNQMLKDVMTKGNVLFMYERLGTWLNHFLIDEFQDTSAMQYNNLKPLIEESTSGGKENLVIGDEKQCIYRFRNSDPNLLQTQIVDDFNGSVYVDITKTRNWRSTPNVIRFNNMLFDNFVRKGNVEGTYDSLIQTVNTKSHCNDGMVKITYVKVSKDEKEKGREEDETTYRRKVIARIPALINDIRKRGYALKDIAILVNKNHEGSEIIDALFEYNRKEENEADRIEVVSGEAMKLSKSPAVRSVVSNLRYFDSINLTEGGSDAVAVAREREEKIKRVQLNFDKAVSELHFGEDRSDEDKGRDMGKALRESFGKEACRKASHADAGVDATLHYSDEYLSLRNKLVSEDADAFDLISIVENIICNTISEEVREKEKAFLMAFMDYVIDYCSRYSATIHSFLKWWNDNPDLTVNSGSGANAVTVMTVHKSKGLEFPCVIVPFAIWDMYKVDSYLWLPKDKFLQADLFKDIDSDIVPPIVRVEPKYMDICDSWQSVLTAIEKESLVDNLNRTYVAFTRAINELHIFTLEPDEDKRRTDNKARLCDYLVAARGALNAEAAENLKERIKGRINREGEEVGVALVEREENGETVYVVGDDRQQYEHKEVATVDAAAIAAAKEAGLPLEVPQYHSGSRQVPVSLPEIYNARQERGLRMHALFSMLKSRRHRDRVLCVARRRGLIRDCYDYAKKIVDNALDNPATAPWFADDNQVIAERTVCCDGKHLRPDRIIRTADGRVVVIDYKFGADHNSDKKYRKQVQTYIDTLAKAGMTVDEGYVWYPESGEIIRVK